MASRWRGRSARINLGHGDAQHGPEGNGDPIGDRTRGLPVGGRPRTSGSAKAAGAERQQCQHTAGESDAQNQQGQPRQIEPESDRRPELDVAAAQYAPLKQNCAYAENQDERCEILPDRSEERRVGKECVSTLRTWRSREPEKKKKE